MNYLTNYYKNLCEELFAKEKRLIKLLSEMSAAGTTDPGPTPNSPAPNRPLPTPQPGTTPAAPRAPGTPGPDKKPKPKSPPTPEEIATEVWNRYYRALVDWLQRGRVGRPPALPSISAPPGYVGPFPGLGAPWNLHPPPPPPPPPQPNQPNQPFTP